MRNFSRTLTEPQQNLTKSDYDFIRISAEPSQSPCRAPAESENTPRRMPAESLQDPCLTPSRIHENKWDIWAAVSFASSGVVLGFRNCVNDCQEVRFDAFLALAPKVEKMIFGSIALGIFWPLLQKSAQLYPGHLIWEPCGLGFRSWQKVAQGKTRCQDFLGSAPEIDKMIPGTLDLKTFWFLAPEVDKRLRGETYLMTFSLVPQFDNMITRRVFFISGVCFRRRQSNVVERQFEDFLALAPEVDKTIPSRLGLMICWHWFQTSTICF